MRDGAVDISILVGRDEIRNGALHSWPRNLRQSTLCVLCSELLRLRRFHWFHILYTFLLASGSGDDACTSWCWVDPGSYFRGCRNAFRRHYPQEDWEVLLACFDSFHCGYNHICSASSGTVPASRIRHRYLRSIRCYIRAAGHDNYSFAYRNQ